MGTAVVGAIVDLQITDSIGALFQGCYLVGSVAAIAAVRRGNLFGPMVAPPLVLAVTVPTLVLTASGLPSGSDTLAKILAISTPLINAFPIMAITTGLTVGIGFYRIYRERDPHGQQRTDSKRERDSARQGGKDRDRGGRGGSGGGKRPRDGVDEPRRPGPGAAAGQGGRRQPQEEQARRGRGRPGEGRGGERGKDDRPQRESVRIDPTRADLGRSAPKSPHRRPPAPPDAGGGPRRPRPTPPEEPPRGRKPEPPQQPRGGRSGMPPRRNRPWEDDRG